MYLSPFFFFNDTATTEIYTLSLHDALPIYPDGGGGGICDRPGDPHRAVPQFADHQRRRSPQPERVTRSSTLMVCKLRNSTRSEEHTSELQSQSNLVCRLLLEKTNKPPPPSR